MLSAQNMGNYEKWIKKLQRLQESIQTREELRVSSGLSGTGDNIETTATIIRFEKVDDSNNDNNQ